MTKINKMKRKVIMLSTAAILAVFTLSVFAQQGKEEDDKPKCIAGVPLIGICTWTVEGTSKCVSAAQNLNCSA